MSHKEKQAPIKGFFKEYRFLSNFWMIPVIYEDVEYPSVEHAYQAAKTLNLEERKRIRRAETAREAKVLGREATLRKNWNPIFQVEGMTGLLQQKFADPRLRHLLLQTDNAYIEETNNWNDTFWGVCNGVGHNHLGEILMGIRKQIQGPKKSKRPKHDFPQNS